MLDLGRNRKQTQSQREKVMTQVLELASRTLKQLINIFKLRPPHPKYSHNEGTDEELQQRTGTIKTKSNGNSRSKKYSNRYEELT